MEPRVRELIYQVHLWTGLIAAVLLIPIGITGAYLVWHVPIDAALSPEREVAESAAVALGPQQYIERAAAAFPDADPALLSMPEGPGEAVNVILVYPQRAPSGAQQPRIFTWLHPSDGRLLDSSDSTETFIGWAHRFHFYLSADPSMGRQVVGIVGVLLLASIITAVWLWWPKLRNLWRSLTWQKRIRTSQNLHFVIGIWIAIPMFVIGVSGVYLSFPRLSASLVDVFTTIEQPIPLAEPAPVRPLSVLRLTPGETIESAREALGDADARVLMLAIPSVDSSAWRVGFATASGRASLLVEDDDGSARPAPPPAQPAPGDRFSNLMHALHDGQQYGIAYQVLLVSLGLLPMLLTVTGIMIWLRRRTIRKRAAAARA